MSQAYHLIQEFAEAHKQARIRYYKLREQGEANGIRSLIARAFETSKRDVSELLRKS